MRAGAKEELESVDRAENRLCPPFSAQITGFLRSTLENRCRRTQNPVFSVCFSSTELMSLMSPCNGHVNFVKHLYYILRIIGSYVFNVKRPAKTCGRWPKPVVTEKKKLDHFERKVSTKPPE